MRYVPSCLKNTPGRAFQLDKEVDQKKIRVFSIAHLCKVKFTFLPADLHLAVSEFLDLLPVALKSRDPTAVQIIL